jgi:L-alanine-DL-glutamate epimerase-like enolase superfamily enzyme
MSRLSNPQERGEQAANLKAEGWKAFKVKAHFPTMKEDIQVVEAVRKTCGDDFILMVDGNKAGLNLGSRVGISWDFTRAAQTALAYERLGVYWLEEPLPRYDYDDLARLKSLTPMHLAGGEANRGLNEFNDLLGKNSFDIIQPEVMINGVNILRKAAVLAEAKYKIIEPHRGDNRLGTIACLHLVASWPNSPMHEVFNDHPLGNYDIPFAIFENPVTLDKDGYFNLPQGPGLGMKIRQDLIVKS